MKSVSFLFSILRKMKYETLEPSQKQRSQFQDLAPGKLAFVQFLIVKDQEDFHSYI